MSATNVRSQLRPVTCSTKKLVMAPPGDQMAKSHKKGFEHPLGDQGSNFLFTYRKIYSNNMLSAFGVTPVIYILQLFLHIPAILAIFFFVKTRRVYRLICPSISLHFYLENHGKSSF